MNEDNVKLRLDSSEVDVHGLDRLSTAGLRQLRNWIFQALDTSSQNHATADEFLEDEEVDILIEVIVHLDDLLQERERTST